MQNVIVKKAFHPFITAIVTVEHRCYDGNTGDKTLNIDNVSPARAVGKGLN